MLSFLLSICDPKYHDRITMLVNKYHDDLMIYAKHILKTAGVSSYQYDAQDVVQNLYMKLSKYCEKVRFYENPIIMKGYLKKILKNEAMTFLKDFEYLESLDDVYYEVIDEDSFIEMLNSKERYEEVVSEIYSMKEIYSYTLSYRFCDEMDVANIAKMLGVQEKTVYTRIERGKKLLLDSLQRREMNV